MIFRQLWSARWRLRRREEHLQCSRQFDFTERAIFVGVRLLKPVQQCELHFCDSGRAILICVTSFQQRRADLLSVEDNNDTMRGNTGDSAAACSTPSRSPWTL